MSRITRCNSSSAFSSLFLYGFRVAVRAGRAEDEKEIQLRTSQCVGVDNTGEQDYKNHSF